MPTPEIKPINIYPPEGSERTRTTYQWQGINPWIREERNLRWNRSGRTSVSVIGAETFCPA
jgi:hypothetical protein